MGVVRIGVLAACLLFWAAPARASSFSAHELLREARAHAAAHEDDLAVRRYSEALKLDPSFADAYMGLGEIRIRQGDAREAERVYSVALAHLPALHVALLERARARWTLGLHHDAEQDLEEFAAQTDDANIEGAFRELAGWYGEDGRIPAQLAVWRRMLAEATRTGDAALLRDARTMVRALQILVRPADPATSASDRGEPRRTFALIARRAG